MILLDRGDNEMAKTIKVTNLDNDKYVLINSDLNTVVNMVNYKLEKGLKTMYLTSNVDLFGGVGFVTSSFAVSFNLSNIQIEEISVEDSSVKTLQKKPGEDYFEFYSNELNMLKLNKLAYTLLKNYEVAESTTLITRDRNDSINQYVAYNQEKEKYTIATIGGNMNFKNDQELELPYKIVISPVTNRFKTILRKQNNQNINQLIDNNTKR